MYSGQALHQPKFSVVVRFLVSLHKTFSAFILIFLLDTSQGMDVQDKVCEHCEFPQLTCACFPHTKNSFRMSSDFSCFLILGNNIKHYKLKVLFTVLL